ncbi:MAG: hypothetical protein K9L17_04210 [Clostridiales bacterium]|nr:hypothetical protein [Clostridiales bacterium]MCF8021884.1 hypothetical protein [Clostridiales bacterium]
MSDFERDNITTNFASPSGNNEDTDEVKNENSEVEDIDLNESGDEEGASDQVSED